MSIRFDERVAIVTGAGSGLGRAHALALAARGARVVVNDVGGAVDGSGGSSAPAQAVVDEIVAGGGEAIVNDADVTDPAQVDAMVAAAVAEWNRVDILINNAGILRDVSFAKMTLQDFRKVLDVHLVGSFNCCKAAWPLMKQARYGRILMTTSATGLFGNFGQANYGAAKLGVVGLMNVLQVEGGKDDIRVNALSPAAATRMTESVFAGPIGELMSVEDVAPAALFLVSEDAPRGAIIAAAAGGYARAFIVESEGLFLNQGERTPEVLAERFGQLSDRADARTFDQSVGEVMKFMGKAAAAAGLSLPRPPGA